MRPTMFLCSAIHTYIDGAAIGSSLGFSFDMQPVPGIKQPTSQLVDDVLYLLRQNFVYLFGRDSKTNVYGSALKLKALFDFLFNRK